MRLDCTSLSTEVEVDLRMVCFCESCLQGRREIYRCVVGSITEEPKNVEGDEILQNEVQKTNGELKN